MALKVVSIDRPYLQLLSPNPKNKDLDPSFILCDEKNLVLSFCTNHSNFTTVYTPTSLSSRNFANIQNITLKHRR
jgi:hypothetical protein